MVADITIKARAAAATKALKRLRALTKDLEPVLEEIGRRLTASTKRRFFSQRAPAGKRWKKSVTARRERRRTLYRSGALYRSIEAVASKTDVQVGTDIWYASRLQLGGRIKNSKAKGARSASLAFVKTLGRGVSSRDLLKAAKTASKRSRPTTNVGYYFRPRRFLGISKKDRRDITATIREAMNEAWK